MFKINELEIASFLIKFYFNYLPIPWGGAARKTELTPARETAPPGRQKVNVCDALLSPRNLSDCRRSPRRSWPRQRPTTDIRRGHPAVMWWTRRLYARGRLPARQ